MRGVSTKDIEALMELITKPYHDPLAFIPKKRNPKTPDELHKSASILIYTYMCTNIYMYKHI